MDPIHINLDCIFAPVHECIFAPQHRGVQTCQHLKKIAI